MRFSPISYINTPELSHTGPSPLLRQGQILQGEILKLYPENKAEINLGGNRLIATLEVGLELGARYHFQVAANANFLQLRVLGEQLKRQENIDLSKLLKHLKIKDNKQNLQLLQILSRNAIPFDKVELHAAVQLLKGAKNKKIAMGVLAEMIAKKLPLTEAVFQSLITSRSATFTEQISPVIQQLLPAFRPFSGQTGTDREFHSQTLQKQLYEAITRLTEKPATLRDSLVAEITGENKTGNETLFRSLQGLGLVPLDIDFKSWVREWESFNSDKFISSTIKTITAPLPQLPFKVNEQEFFHILQQLEPQKGKFRQAIQQLISKWNPKLSLQLASGDSLPRELLTELHTDLKATVSTYLPDSRFYLLNPELSQQKILSLYRGLEAISRNESLFIRMKQAAEQDNFLSLPLQEKFKEHIQQSIRLLGLDYENRLVNEKNPVSLQHTIKGMLLQLMTGNDSLSQEQHTRLLQFIQGLQLQSINDTPTFVQVALQLPAERLGLVKDLAIKFEGKKNEKDEINPEFCRIIFYLELERLKETVIDVHIQKRGVSITLFNNTQGLPLISKRFKEKLEENLHALNYHLTSITFKKLDEKEKQPFIQDRSRIEENQGVDYRI